MVPRVDKYQGLKNNVAKLGLNGADPRVAYGGKDPFVKQFISYCEQDDSGTSINPYPLLH